MKSIAYQTPPPTLILDLEEGELSKAVIIDEQNVRISEAD